MVSRLLCRTAIACDIREQCLAYLRALIKAGHPFDGSMILDEELRLSFLPPVTNVVRPEEIASKTFTPTLNELDEDEVDRLEKEREKDQKKKKRQTKGRKAFAVPEKETYKTRRTLLGVVVPPPTVKPKLSPPPPPPAPSRRAAALAASAHIASLAKEDLVEMDDQRPGSESPSPDESPVADSKMPLPTRSRHPASLLTTQPLVNPYIPPQQTQHLLQHPHSAQNGQPVPPNQPYNPNQFRPLSQTNFPQNVPVALSLQHQDSQRVHQASRPDLRQHQQQPFLNQMNGGFQQQQQQQSRPHPSQSMPSPAGQPSSQQHRSVQQFPTNSRMMNDPSSSQHRPPFQQQGSAQSFSLQQQQNSNFSSIPQQSPPQPRPQPNPQPKPVEIVAPAPSQPSAPPPPKTEPPSQPPVGTLNGNYFRLQTSKPSPPPEVEPAVDEGSPLSFHEVASPSSSLSSLSGTPGSTKPALPTVLPAAPEAVKTERLEPPRSSPKLRTNSSLSPPPPISPRLPLPQANALSMNGKILADAEPASSASSAAPGQGVSLFLVLPLAI
jgi:hypothetical protein